MLTLVVTMLASCCPRAFKSRNRKVPLTETTWVMIQKNGMAFEANDGYSFVMQEDGKFNGRGDCNSLMGEYELNGKKGVKFNSLALTRAMCPNQKAEDEYVRMLSNVDSYTLDVTLLLLYDGDELVAIFEARGARK